MKKDEEYEEIDPRGPLEEVFVADEEDEEDEARAPRQRTEAPTVFPDDTHYGPWEKDAAGVALVVKTVQFPRVMWHVCLDLAKLLEQRGAASYIRRAVALQMRRDAEEDPRVALVLQRHGALAMVGIEEE